MMRIDCEGYEDELYHRARSLALDRLVEWIAAERNKSTSYERWRTLADTLHKVWEFEDLELAKKSIKGKYDA